MAGYLLSTYPLTDERINQHPLSRRGKGKAQICMEPFNAIIFTTKEYGAEYYQADGILILVDGTAYTSDHAHLRTAEYCYQLYVEQGIDFVHTLDGDFNLSLLDLNQKLLYFTTDTFKTKPLFYCIDGKHIGVSSYQSALKLCGHNNIENTSPNTCYTVDLTCFNLLRAQLYPFDLRQYKDSYDAWIDAFDASVKKRAHTVHAGELCLGLSSGYDSGALACALGNLQYEFTAYTITGNENRQVLKRRFARCKNVTILQNDRKHFLAAYKHLATKCEKYNHPHFEMLDDEGSWGMAQLCSQSLLSGKTTCFSGIGADEITSDYGHNGVKYSNTSEFGGLFPKDLDSLFPWRNFFSGSMECYLAREEYIAGSFGIEMRYPFLDRKLVQEFLWLDCSLKNQTYKAPISAYLEANHYPYQKEKIGFFYFPHEFDAMQAGKAYVSQLERKRSDDPN